MEKMIKKRQAAKESQEAPVFDLYIRSSLRSSEHSSIRAISDQEIMNYGDRSEDVEIRSPWLNRSWRWTNVPEMLPLCQLLKAADLFLLSLRFASKDQDIGN